MFNKLSQSIIENWQMLKHSNILLANKNEE
jgi:hypothetical protein